jgi:hypothetical protein
MYLALFSVAFGSVLTFVQAAALFNILDIENYVAYRAVLNTMNIAAPFLCLGFDSAAPVLRRTNPGFPFFWNLFVLHLFALLLFIISALILPTVSKLLPLILGLAASTSVAAGIIVANHYRVEGEIRRYFIGVNIVDKLVRTIIIIVLAVFVKDILLWSILLSVLCFAYVGIIALQTGCPLRLDWCVFVKHLSISFPKIFAVLSITFLTRLPFYTSYLFDNSLVTAKVDICLLFSLFLLIPVLNNSKIEEASSTGLTHEYIAAMKLGWIRLIGLELLVSFGIIGLACIGVITGYALQNDLLQILLPLMIGMVLISSQPNYVLIIFMSGNTSLGIKTSLSVVAFTATAFLPRMVMESLSIPWLFVFAATMYCVVGCFAIRSLGIKIGNFWRWHYALILILCIVVALISCYQFLG